MGEHPNGRPWLTLLFWSAVCGSAAVVLLPAFEEWEFPGGEFSGLAVFSLLLVAAVLGMIAVAVAVIGKPLAYAFGLALVSVPLVWAATASLGHLSPRLSAPSVADQDSGRGYFTAPADRALAGAIVARNAAQVAALAPAANLNAPGSGKMTFMRLALEAGHADPDIVGALLRAGVDPDQDSSALYQVIYSDKNEGLLRRVIEARVDLNEHMGHGQWIYFVRYDWPEGLALMLDGGVDTETPDAMGYTEIMRAVQAGSWHTAELLLAHGARTDHVGNDGRGLRDLLSKAITESRDPVPPPIAALQASLR